MTQLHSNLINLENEARHWHLVDLSLFSRKLNRLLDKPDIQQRFHDATLGYDSFCRWDRLHRSDFSVFPEWKATPPEGRKLLRPIDAECSDWRFWRGRGRPPKFLDFVCAQACHWLAYANLLLAQRLFPDLHWVVLSGDFHSTVACPDERLLFDLNYSADALDVSAPDAIRMVLKDPDWVVCDEEQGNPYDLSLDTWEAITFCTLLDRTPEDQRESVLTGMKQCIEDEELEAVEHSEEPARELVAA